jgi:hypothetical protein
MCVLDWQPMTGSCNLMTSTMTHLSKEFVFGRISPVVQCLLLSASLASPLLTSGVALADTPCGDQTCPKGFVCETYASPCPAIAKEGGGTSTCQSSPAYACVNAPCDTDADCASSMVCHETTIASCSGGATRSDCDPNAGDCPTLTTTPDVCTTTINRTCVARYELPCTVDSDCGDGFSCEATSVTTCSASGSGGATGVGSASANPGTAVDVPVPAGQDAPASGGATANPLPTTSSAPATTEPDCTTSTSEVKSCQLKIVPCSVDADCQSGFTCTAVTENASCAVSSDGTSTDCSAPKSSKVCAPPYARLQSGSDGSVALAASENGASTTGANASDKSAAASPTTAPADDSTNAAATPEVSGSGGCVIAPSESGRRGRFAVLLLAVGFALSRGRRRCHN